MHIRFRDKDTGMVTMAFCERHTMSRTIRRYPSRGYDLVGGDFAGRPVRLASTRPTRALA